MESERRPTGGPVLGTVVRSRDGQAREYLGIPFDLLASGERLMVTRMRFRSGMVAAPHSHPHEQAGYVVSGRYRQTIAGVTHQLAPGDSYVVPGGVEHSMEVLEDGFVIDVFTPPREEFRTEPDGPRPSHSYPRRPRRPSGGP